MWNNFWNLVAESWFFGPIVSSSHFSEQPEGWNVSKSEKIRFNNLELIKELE